MRIVYLCSSNIFAGSENVTLQIAKAMQPRHDVWYCFPNGGIIREFVETAGVSFYPVPEISIGTVKKLHHSLRPDVFHACDFRASVLCAVSGVPFIAHLHSDPPWLRRPGFYSLALAYAVLRAKKVIAVSDSILEEYIFSRWARRKFVTLNNVIDAAEIRKRAEKDKNAVKKSFDLGFIGRLTYSKDPLLFVEIARAVSLQIPGTHAVMIGGGKMREETERRIRQYGLENRIELTGFLPNPFPVLNQCKIVVAPSRYEGFSLVTAESLALGKPVLASPVGGMKDIVTPDCGALCAGEENFTKEAVRLLRDGGLYAQKSAAARKRAELYSGTEQYFSAIAALYVSRAC